MRSIFSIKPMTVRPPTMNSVSAVIRLVTAATIVLCLVRGTAALGATTTLADLPDGFYRNRGTKTVYRVQDGAACAVISQGHLKALGATNRSVQVLATPVDFLNGKASNPPCPWPDGLYRRQGETTTIKLSNGTACILSSTDQDVIEIGSNDDVTAGKDFVGRCDRS